VETEKNRTERDQGSTGMWKHSNVVISEKS
jgi:hypothetical protein